ncbi:MAG TPA: hypothetical protein VE964_17230 [Myxococcales bacterium]|nr:hypothetical protein [Myxococcales bacterium]
MPGLKKALLVALALALACTTPSMGRVFSQREEGRGVSKVYPVDDEQAWDIAIRVFRWEGAGAIEEHREDGYMLTTIFKQPTYSKGSTVSYAGAWIEPVANGAKVTCIVSGEPVIDAQFHDRFAQAVAFLQQGRPVPDEAPPLPPEEFPRCESDLDCTVGICVVGRCRR